MGRRFKLRISRVIPSFQSCRSKDPSTFPDHPTVISPFLRHSTTVVTPPPSSTKHHRSSFKSHVSSAFIGCGFGSTFSDTNSDHFQWQEDDQWHVVAKVNGDESPRQKIYKSSADNSDDGIWPMPLPLPVQERKKRQGKTKTAAARSKLATTNLDEGGGEDETETLVSSFSSDSSTDFDPQLETIRERSRKKKKSKSKLKKKKTKKEMVCRSSTECTSPARLSVLAKLMRTCRVEGKVKGSFAVVKKSEDPYEDFKGSMIEMIVEKEMFEERDLEHLLQCFLSLNSRYHHRVIIEAFTEIWDTIFFHGG